MVHVKTRRKNLPVKDQIYFSRVLNAFLWVEHGSVSDIAINSTSNCAAEIAFLMAVSVLSIIFQLLSNYFH